MKNRKLEQKVTKRCLADQAHGTEITEEKNGAASPKNQT